MPHWNDLPNEVRVMILREFCASILSEYSQFGSRFDDIGESIDMLLSVREEQPLKHFYNALLTCRDFNELIMTKVKVSGNQPPSSALQNIQYANLMEYLYEKNNGWLHKDKVWYYEIYRASAVLGSVWNSPLIDGTAPVNDLLQATGPVGEVVLICLLGNFLEKCKEIHSGTRTVEVQKINRYGNKSSKLAFTVSDYSVGGQGYYHGFYSFYSVSRFRFMDSPSPDSQVQGAKGEDLMKSKELTAELEPVELLPPDISTAEPGTWWLAKRREGRKDWCLVNYKEKKLHIGPIGVGAKWPDILRIEDARLWDRPHLTRQYLNECAGRKRRKLGTSLE